MTHSAWRWLAAAVVFVLGTSGAAAQDMSVADVLIDGEGWQLVGEGFQFTEGPAVDAKGDLYFTDVPRDKIFKVGGDGKIAEFVSESFRTNGLMFGPDGRLYGCQNGKKRIVAYDAHGKPTTIAEDVASNDLVVTKDGGVYCTDPENHQVWYVDPQGNKRVVDKGIERPNGIILWPDQATLVVADTAGAHLWTFRVEPDGSLSHKEAYYKMQLLPGRKDSGADGMTVDTKGRVYVTTRAGLQMFDPTGRLAGVILSPQNKWLSNVVLGGPKLDTLYVTSSDKVYQRKTKATGVRLADSVREAELPVVVERAFPKLKFRLPLVLTHAGDGSNRVFVVAQQGVIHVFPNRPDAAETKEFLNISERVLYKDEENEQGLLGLAFHPRYKENGEFFVYYSPTDAALTTVISRFRVSKDDPNKADSKSEEELFRLKHPFWNHKGGTIVFGPDGYLYVGLGDGGSANDPFGNGQNLKKHLGKILRIDVDRQDSGKKYAIPKDNPYADGRGGAQPEIWASGVRNIWRMAFDRETGELWAGEVGQDLWEEINLIKRGGNYGWNLREAKHKFGPRGSDPRDDLIDPIWEYHHSVGKSITGGHVYRGKKVPELTGKYLYGDYVTGILWALDYNIKEKRVVANYTIKTPTSPLPIMSFGEDEPGEAYFMTRDGAIYLFKSRE